MSENNNGLISLFDNVSGGGIIGECVLKVEEGVARIQAADLTNSFFVQSTAATTMEDGVYGIGELDKISKFFKAYKDRELAIVKKDHTLSIKPVGGGASLSYLLREVDLIPTYNPEWDKTPDRISLLDVEGKIELTVEKVSDFLTMMGLFNPSNIELNANKNGKVSLHGGNATTHQFDENMGVDKTFPECSMALDSGQLQSIFKNIDFAAKAYLGVVLDDNAIVITNGDSAWVVQKVA